MKKSRVHDFTTILSSRAVAARPRPNGGGQAAGADLAVGTQMPGSRADEV